MVESYDKEMVVAEVKEKRKRMEMHVCVCFFVCERESMKNCVSTCMSVCLLKKKRMEKMLMGVSV